MLGKMQDWDLLVTNVIDHAAREAPTREIVTHWADGSETRTDWTGIRRDALKMAQALEALGIKKGDRVASLAMNHARHLVSWYGVAGMGGVLHTINPRLFEDQLEYIANHAEDRVLLYDAAFQPIVDKMRSKWTSIEHYICYDPPEGSDALGFEEWIGAQDGDYHWATIDERDPCMLCYTSGTTGKPTVVAYTQNDIDVWSSVMARSIRAAGGHAGDIVHVAYGYGLFTGGLGAHYGAEKLGCDPACRICLRCLLGHAAGGADVPRGELGPAVCGRDGWDQVRLLRSERAGGAVRPDGARERDRQRGRADRVARNLPIL